MKKAALFLLVVAIVLSSLCLTASADSLAERYEAAEMLMVDGKYLEAAVAFDALMTYSDASKMAMYCRALYMAESKMYSTAVTAFQTLGDFKDSASMAKYYTAMSYQDAGTLASTSEASYSELRNAKKSLQTAQDLYEEIALFKDCLARISSCGDMISSIAQEEAARDKSNNDDANDKTVADAVAAAKEAAAEAVESAKDVPGEAMDSGATLGPVSNWNQLLLSLAWGEGQFAQAVPVKNAGSQAFWAQVSEDAWSGAGVTLWISMPGTDYSFSPGAGSQITDFANSTALDGSGIQITAYQNGEPVDSYMLYISTGSMPDTEPVEAPTPEPQPSKPQIIEVPVRYVDESGNILRSGRVLIETGHTMTVNCAEATWPDNYELISADNINITVDEQGKPQPEVIVFCFRLKTPEVTQELSPAETPVASVPFTNKYGSATTICAHLGCTNYIASSGDTNCCTLHSNKCLTCGKYIDEDAAYCMSCLESAARSIQSQSAHTCERCSKSATTTLTVKQPSGETSSFYMCQSHYKEYKDYFNSKKGWSAW